MKTHILIFFFFTIVSIKAQEKTKDTLFFNIDKYYTTSPTLTPNLSKQTYAQRVEIEKKQMEKTKTNGYVSFIGNGYLIKNLNPKKILSIKDYIENRKFYYDGKYNQIVDNRKLKEYLTDKYTIFFVNGDEFIEPRHLEYVSYYPLRDDNWNVIDNKVKDTLYFKLDNNYVYKSKIQSNPNFYLLKDSKDGEYFTFVQQEILKKLKKDKLLSLKDFIDSLSFYKKEKLHISEYYLADFLSNYIVFLVNEDKSEYIKVYSGIITED